MTHTLNITDETFQRLEARAVGFDKPEAVIIRLLDEIEGKTTVKPDLIFHPADENEFKQQLIRRKEAQIVLYKADGSSEKLYWNANRFTEESNLRGNLWSGYLRGWKKKNIVKAEISIAPQD